MFWKTVFYIILGYWIFFYLLPSLPDIISFVTKSFHELFDKEKKKK